MTSNIQIETNKDHIVPTTPALRVDMSKIEITPDDRVIAPKPRVEIPEKRKGGRQMDSDSDASDLLYLANQKKIAPVYHSDKDDSDHEKDSSSGKKKDPDHASARINIDGKYNSDSESHSSAGKSRRTGIVLGGNGENGGNGGNGGNDDYKPRYSSERSISDHREGSETKNAAISFLNSNLFSKRTNALSPEDIRIEKAKLLHQYDSKNKDNMYSNKRLSMMNDLEEIRNEVHYINSKRQMDNSTSTWKTGLMLFVNGCVWLNSYYKDPFDVDLTDWARQMKFDVEKAGLYDDVLEDLVIKWSGKVPMAPEMKLVLMMGSSLFFGVLAKKNEKAAMEKQAQDERRTREVAIMAAREEMAKMYAQREHDQEQMRFQQQVKHQQQREQQQGYASQGYGGYMPREPQYNDLSPLHGQIPIGKKKDREREKERYTGMQGPSVSDDVLLRIRERIIDSTDGGDDSTTASRFSDRDGASSRTNGSKRSKRSKGSKGSKDSKRSRGSKADRADRVGEVDETDEKKGEEQVQVQPHRGPGRPKKIPVSSTATEPAVPRRGPGRPRKYPTANNVISLQP
jgi:hypothetical protein